MNARTLLLLAAFALATAPAFAQTTPTPRSAPRQSTTPVSPPPAPQPPPGQTQGDAPPYEPELLRLAEMLGALHHLRAVCGAGDAQLWRDRMSQLLQAEAATPARRARLAGAFNSGFESYQRSYQSCTPAAQYVIRQFLSESAQLARGVAARYSN